MAKTTSLAKMIKQVKNNICVHGVYASYVRFTILNNSKYGDVSFMTDNSGVDQSICCISSFENVKNGSGQANSFSITISFSPSKAGLFYPKTGSDSLDYSNVNLIDEILNLNSKDSVQTKCHIQYGYTYPINMDTPVYEGTIIDYSVEVVNGILNYTITGYSGLPLEFKDSKITIEGSTNSEEPKMKKPTDMVQEIFDKYIKDVSDYVLEWADDTKGTDKEIEIPSIQDTSVLTCIRSLLDLAEYSGDTEEETELEYRSTYHMLISDALNTDGKKTITIERYDPAEKKSKQDSSDTVRFSWMGAADNDSMDYVANAMVLDFRANFKGSVTMAYDYSTIVEKAKKVGLDASGNVVETVGTTTPITGANTDNENTTNLNLWASRLQYVYGATLVLIGVPCEIPILENVYIAPMICGQEHHTGGLYKILKVTDLIDTSGFITTIELVKNVGEDAATRGIKKKRAELIEKRDKYYSHPSSDSDGRAKQELSREIAVLDEILGDGGVD